MLTQHLLFVFYLLLSFQFAFSESEIVYGSWRDKKDVVKPEATENKASTVAKEEKEPRFSIGLGVLAPSYTQKFDDAGKTKLEYNQEKGGWSYSLSNANHPTAVSASQPEKKVEVKSGQPQINIYHQQGFPMPQIQPHAQQIQPQVHQIQPQVHQYQPQQTQLPQYNAGYLPNQMYSQGGYGNGYNGGYDPYTANPYGQQQQQPYGAAQNTHIQQLQNPYQMQVPQNNYNLQNNAQQTQQQATIQPNYGLNGGGMGYGNMGYGASTMQPNFMYGQYNQGGMYQNYQMTPEASNYYQQMMAPYMGGGMMASASSPYMSGMSGMAGTGGLYGGGNSLYGSGLSGLGGLGGMGASGGLGGGGGLFGGGGLASLMG